MHALHGKRGFCCGGRRIRGCGWRRSIGKRVNVERVDEALALDPDIVSTACPFCMVMLSDAVTSKQQDGSAREDLEVLDVTQILARSLAPAKRPALVGGGSDAGEAPVGGTPDETALADTPQLAQTSGEVSATTTEPASDEPAYAPTADGEGRRGEADRRRQRRPARGDGRDG